MRKGIWKIAALILVLTLNGCMNMPAQKTEDKPSFAAGYTEEEPGEAGPAAENTVPSTVTEVPESEPLPSVSEAAGISTENTNQCADFAVKNGRIYYKNYYDNGNLYSVNTDGGSNRKLIDDRLGEFCVSDGRIYYENGSDGGKLYAIDTDGSNRRRLSRDGSANVFWNVEGGKIIYSSKDDHKLYIMNTDGSGRMKLSDDRALYTITSGDRIYYYAWDGSERGIYSIKTDGSHKVKLSDDVPFGLTEAYGWIYYANEQDNYKLYAMKTDGSGRYKVTDDYILNMNVAGGRIYYTNVHEGKTAIYSMKMDGSDRRLLSRENANWLALWDGRIYYMMTGANIYSMDLDGSGREVALNVDRDRYKEVTYEVKASLGGDMPQYRFTATGKVTVDDRSVGYIMGLRVQEETGRIILSADFSQVNDDEVIGSPVFREMMDTMGLHVVDVNFDGYKDVIILSNFSGAHANTWYNCWLWDSGAGALVESESFSGICNPAIDPDKKCIYSSGGSGAAYWGGSIYRYLNGEFVMTNNLDTYEEGLTETELVNGAMKVVRQVTYNNEKGKMEEEMEYYKNSPLWQLDHPHWYWVGGHLADQWLGE